MTEYKKIYLEAFGYDIDDSTQCVPSEISGDKAVDIHHIISRGKGGENRIENLMALTRTEHIDYGDKTLFMYYLLRAHQRVLQINKIPFDNDWFEKYLKKYEPFKG